MALVNTKAGMTERLCAATLAALPDAVARPAYDRAALQPGIVHLGIGAFMRAHLAVATEAALQADGDLRWGIVGVSLRRPDTRDALAPQDGLYTVAVRDADEHGKPRQQLQVVGCVMQTLVAPEDPVAVLEAIAHPATRIVSLTITEKGYLSDPATGALQDTHADIVHDLAHPQAPRTALGFIVHGLALRRARGLGPLTLLSLDNLSSNGTRLRGLVAAFAERLDSGLRDGIVQDCRFPNSMVDRIVPRTTDVDRDGVDAAMGCHDAWPVIAEPFFDWAVEDHFAAGRPAWERGGGRIVAEAAPWELLKLRMVNGCHSAIAYLGLVAGSRTVDRAMSEPLLRQYLLQLMQQEVETTLPALPGLDLAAYRERLLQRFANPALAHRTQQIAMDGSQKVPQRWLATVRDRLAAGQPIARLGLAVAAWLHFLRGYDEREQDYAIDDPLASELLALTRSAELFASPQVRAQRLIGFAPVFGDLASHPVLVAAVAPALESLRQRGVTRTLEDWA